jgi:hypothetical protein
MGSDPAREAGSLEEAQPGTGAAAVTSTSWGQTPCDSVRRPPVRSHRRPFLALVPPNLIEYAG